MTFTLNSSAFPPGGEIPAAYTCDGKNQSPPLEWTDAPAGTRSYALIVDDPDAPDPAAPKVTWVHWILYDIPATVSSLSQGLDSKHLPSGAREGLNGGQRIGYSGPCPPIGRHRYFHKLYALDKMLGDLHHPTAARIEAMLADHVLGRAELVGTYQRSR